MRERPRNTSDVRERERDKKRTVKWTEWEMGTERVGREIPKNIPENKTETSC